LAEELPWPPRKEDLERLYVAQGLSAAKIARVYGLKYESEKTAESTILYHLKRNGIKRRDRAAHIRKVTEEMVDGWVSRYRSGESLKQIAGTDFDPVTVFNHLRRRGVQLRDKVEAQIQAVTKHERVPFSADPHEKAYLVGFAQGDLYSTRHGRSIRVKTSTTHPAMAELFCSLFTRYGPVYMYPRKAGLTGYEWSLQADLDSSFLFLLEKCEAIPQFVTKRRKTFLHYLAGLIDAEGSLTVRGRRPEISIANTNYALLEGIRRLLSKERVSARIFSKGRSRLGQGNLVFSADVWRHRDIISLLERVPIRHPEKKARARVILGLLDVKTPDKILWSLKWNDVVRSIEDDVRVCVKSAETEYLERRTKSLVSH